MPQGEPLELQLQRERVARTQVEALLESTRLQLIEMEMALRKAREEATCCLTTAASVAPPPPSAPQASPPPLPAASARPIAAKAVSASVAAAAAAPPAPAALAAAARPAAPPKPRVRRTSPKPAAGSLIEAARAAEAIEKASREASPALAPAGGMINNRGRQPLLSTLDLNEGDNRAIVADFVQHLQTRLSNLQACYGNGNATELKWHVTWIKENSGVVGFAPLIQPAADLEQALEKEEKERVPGLLDALITLAERVAVETVRR